MSGGIPRGALTIDGPRPETGREAARLRFFFLSWKSLCGVAAWGVSWWPTPYDFAVTSSTTAYS